MLSDSSQTVLQGSGLTRIRPSPGPKPTRVRLGREVELHPLGRDLKMICGDPAWKQEVEKTLRQYWDCDGLTLYSAL